MVTIFTIKDYWISVDGGWQRARRRLYKNFKINARTSKQYPCMQFLQDPYWGEHGFDVVIWDAGRLRVITAS